jgi:hypothetical protein
MRTKIVLEEGSSTEAVVLNIERLQRKRTGRPPHRQTGRPLFYIHKLIFDTVLQSQEKCSVTFFIIPIVTCIGKLVESPSLFR